MGTKHGKRDGKGDVTRFRDAIQHGGHAWVLAHDDQDYFYECLKCGDRVHVVTVEQMGKARKHGYAYMPLNHRAPWNQDREVRIYQGDGTFRIEKGEPYPPCPQAGTSMPDVSALKEGPLVAVPRGDDGPAGE